MLGNGIRKECPSQEKTVRIRLRHVTEKKDGGMNEHAVHASGILPGTSGSRVPHPALFPEKKEPESISGCRQ